MKKILAVTMVCLLSLSMATMALAQTFTHPELGEEITVTNMAVNVYTTTVFTEVPVAQTPIGDSGKTDIVDATYLVTQTYGQMVANGQMKSADINLLQTIFKTDTNGSSMWTQVQALPLEEQGMALLVALGFYDMVINSPYPFDQAALDLFKQINDNPDMYIDTTKLKANFPITTVTINGKSVPYVAYQLMLVENDSSARLEQYGFAMTDDLWPLDTVSTALPNA